METITDQMLSAMKEGIYLFGEEGKCAFVNRSNAEGDMIGKTASEMGFPDILVKAIDEGCQNKSGHDLLTLREVGQDFECSLSPLIGQDGVARYVVVVVRKMSERVSKDEYLGRSFSLKIMEAQEEERKRISRELHDEIGQMISIIKVNLQQYRRSTDESVREKLLESSIENLGQILKHVRRLSHDLRPSILDDLGLVAALRWYLDNRLRGTGINYDFQVDGKVRRLPAEVETACFRAVQEAVTNIINHAEAKDISITLAESNRCLNLIIKDDGKGFDIPAIREKALRSGHLGLMGMSERIKAVGGKMTVEAAPGRGCMIEISLPIRGEDGTL